MHESTKMLYNGATAGDWRSNVYMDVALSLYDGSRKIKALDKSAPEKSAQEKSARGKERTRKKTH